MKTQQIIAEVKAFKKKKSMKKVYDKDNVVYYFYFIWYKISIL